MEEDLVFECVCRAAANVGEERRFFQAIVNEIQRLEAELLRQNGECIKALAENETLRHTLKLIYKYRSVRNHTDDVYEMKRLAREVLRKG